MNSAEFGTLFCAASAFSASRRLILSAKMLNAAMHKKGRAAFTRLARRANRPAVLRLAQNSPLIAEAALAAFSLAEIEKAVETAS